MPRLVKIKHDDGLTTVDLAEILSVSYWKTVNQTEIAFKNGYNVLIPGDFINQLCSLMEMAMSEAEDE